MALGNVLMLAEWDVLLLSQAQWDHQAQKSCWPFLGT